MYSYQYLVTGIDPVPCSFSHVLILNTMSCKAIVRCCTNEQTSPYNGSLMINDQSKAGYKIVFGENINIKLLDTASPGFSMTRQTLFSSTTLELMEWYL